MSGKSGSSPSVQVVCRIRPENAKEKHLGTRCVSVYSNTITVDANCVITKFNFDYIFGPDQNGTQQDVFKYVGEPVIKSILSGYNGTILAYGQTSSGKTHTMQGPNISDPKEMGIIPRVFFNLFDELSKPDYENIEFTAQISYVEIYMERIRDLLNPSSSDLHVRESPEKGIYIDGVKLCYVSNPNELLNLMEEGSHNRAVAATGMNEGSSRSHSILFLTITQANTNTSSIKRSRLCLVDLAGSEMVRKTNSEGQTLEEAKMINKSLSTLGLVINSLTDGKSTHIPYRDSKLTRVLQDSLGGNSLTTLIICCSPSSYNAAETLSTLRFGQRAKRIKNKPMVNEQKSVHELELLLQQRDDALLLQEKRISVLETVIARQKMNGLSDENLENEIKEIEEKNNFVLGDDNTENNSNNIEGITTPQNNNDNNNNNSSKEEVNNNDNNDNINDDDDEVEAVPIPPPASVPHLSIDIYDNNKEGINIDELGIDELNIENKAAEDVVVVNEKEGNDNDDERKEKIVNDDIVKENEIEKESDNIESNENEKEDDNKKEDNVMKSDKEKEIQKEEEKKEKVEEKETLKQENENENIGKEPKEKEEDNKEVIDKEIIEEENKKEEKEKEELKVENETKQENEDNRIIDQQTSKEEDNIVENEVKKEKEEENENKDNHKEKEEISIEQTQEDEHQLTKELKLQLEKQISNSNQSKLPPPPKLPVNLIMNNNNNNNYEPISASNSFPFTPPQITSPPVNSPVDYNNNSNYNSSYGNSRSISRKKANSLLDLIKVNNNDNSINNNSDVMMMNKSFNSLHFDSKSSSPSGLRIRRFSLNSIDNVLKVENDRESVDKNINLSLMVADYSKKNKLLEDEIYTLRKEYDDCILLIKEKEKIISQLKKNQKSDNSEKLKYIIDDLNEITSLLKMDLRFDIETDLNVISFVMDKLKYNIIQLCDPSAIIRSVQNSPTKEMSFFTSADDSLINGELRLLSLTEEVEKENEDDNGKDKRKEIEELIKFKQENEELLNMNKTLTQELNKQRSMSIDVTELNNEKEKLLKKNISLEEELKKTKTLEIDISNITQEKKDVTIQLEELKKKHNNFIHDYNKRMKKLEDQYWKCLTENNTLQTEINTLRLAKINTKRELQVDNVAKIIKGGRPLPNQSNVDVRNTAESNTSNLSENSSTFITKGTLTKCKPFSFLISPKSHISDEHERITS